MRAHSSPSAVSMTPRACLPRAVTQLDREATR